MRIAMIPARMGSQRLAKKNLLPLLGVPLIRRAVRRCFDAECFDEIYVNSENEAFAVHAEDEGARFHLRPAALGSNSATSEDFVAEFMRAHACDRLFQVHSIAPLVSSARIREFVDYMESADVDTLLSCVEEQIECAYQGKPINFTFDEKTNSQALTPIQRVTWSLSGWTPRVFLAAAEAGECATYAGKVGFYPLDRLSGHIIKRQEDLDMAEALLQHLGDSVQYGA